MTQILRNLIIIMLIAVFIAGGYFLYQLSQNSQVTTISNTNQTENTENNGNENTNEQSNSEIKDTSEISTTQTVLDLLSEQEDVSLVTELIASTELNADLSGSNKFTLFLPSNTALNEQFSEEELDALLLPENKDALVTFLKNHIVKEEYTAAGLFIQINKTVKTEAGTDLKITLINGALFVNDIEVRKVDIRGNNGVIHIINGVLAAVPNANSDETDESNLEETEEELDAEEIEEE